MLVKVKKFRKGLLFIGLLKLKIIVKLVIKKKLRSKKRKELFKIFIFRVMK